MPRFTNHNSSTKQSLNTALPRYIAYQRLWAVFSNLHFMNKDEQLMIIQALGTCIARKRQKTNRRERILKQAETDGKTGLHQLRRNVYKGFAEIKEFEKLKEKLEDDFSDKHLYYDNEGNPRFRGNHKHVRY